MKSEGLGVQHVLDVSNCLDRFNFQSGEFISVTSSSGFIVSLGAVYLLIQYFSNTAGIYISSSTQSFFEQRRPLASILNCLEYVLRYLDFHLKIRNDVVANTTHDSALHR
jgi:hypothetical protein